MEESGPTLKSLEEALSDFEKNPKKLFDEQKIFYSGYPIKISNQCSVFLEQLKNKDYVYVPPRSPFPNPESKNALERKQKLFLNSAFLWNHPIFWEENKIILLQEYSMIPNLVENWISDIVSSNYRKIKNKNALILFEKSLEFTYACWLNETALYILTKKERSDPPVILPKDFELLINLLGDICSRITDEKFVLFEDKEEFKYPIPWYEDCWWKLATLYGELSFTLDCLSEYDYSLHGIGNNSIGNFMNSIVRSQWDNLGYLSLSSKLAIYSSF